MEHTKLYKAACAWLWSDIDARGTPYRYCRGCDDPSKPHTCGLCQRCLKDGHSHHECTAPVA